MERPRNREGKQRKRRKTQTECLRDLYLDAVKWGLTGHLHAGEELTSDPRFSTRPGSLFKDDWPPYVRTMVGPKRLEHLRWCVETILEERVPGDLIECGVWRGGLRLRARRAESPRQNR